MIIDKEIHKIFDVYNYTQGYDVVKYNDVNYINVICAFDIEFTTIPDGDSVKGFMYVWQFNINGHTIIGRTWAEFIQLLDILKMMLNIGEHQRLIIYVHNLGVEFSYFRKYFDWIEMTANSARRPIKAVTKSGFEFRCSYMLSGMSLKALGQSLVKHDVRKLLGDLDYTVLRNNQTPLTDDELAYCKNDVDIIVCYIDELLEQHKSVASIPLTKTGFVRRYCKKHVRNKKVLANIRSLKITDYMEYLQLRRAFQGGFTHGNLHHIGKTLSNVASFDLTSAYPSVMCYEMYPMSTPKYYMSMTYDEYVELTKTKLVIADFMFYDLIEKEDMPEHIISESKVAGGVDVDSDNGRVIMMTKGMVTATNIDFEQYEKFYYWSDVEIRNVRAYRKTYLPYDFVNVILSFYEDKNKLKGVKGREAEYVLKKAMLNSLYGMCVTDIIRDDITYTSDWCVCSHTENEYEDLVNKYNDDNRILYYPWGIFITAYVRRIITNAILELGDDYVYSDTDSVKFLNLEKHKSYFDTFNNTVSQKLKIALDKRYSKANINNKLLGSFDYEGTYDKFKTLGAKRYMTLNNGVLSYTVSGLPKVKPLLYLLAKFDTIDEIFDWFDVEGFMVPEDYSSKLVSCYSDDPYDAVINGVHMHEESGVALKPSGFDATLSKTFYDLIQKCFALDNLSASE